MNTPTTFLKTTCHKCGGHIEFPREGAGERIPCPHCGTEVVLTTTPRARERIVILPKATPIHVEQPTIVIVLGVVGWLEIIVAFVALVLSGVPAAATLIGSGIITLAFAKLIESTHDTAQRLARLELFFQTVVNERK